MYEEYSKNDRDTILLLEEIASMLDFINESRINGCIEEISVGNDLISTINYCESVINGDIGVTNDNIVRYADRLLGAIYDIDNKNFRG